MSTISRWILPCNLSSSKDTLDPITIDLTEQLKTLLLNSVWERNIKYAFDTGLKDTDTKNIKSARIIIYPVFHQGTVDIERLDKIINKHCEEIPAYLELNSYKNWHYTNGLVIIEAKYYSITENIPKEKDFKNYYPNIEISFLEEYDRHIAVVHELKSLFLAALHLSFPSTSVASKLNIPLNDGLFQIKTNNDNYVTKLPSNSFLHAVKIEVDEIKSFKSNLDEISKVWHNNLWGIKRYLKAVESNLITMDHLLDLLYAFESLFAKNVSTDLMKITCIVYLSSSKIESLKLKNILDCAFKIRNDIVHGGKYYDVYESVKIGGKEVAAQKIYWDMKIIVARLIIKALSKMINTKGMKTMSFSFEDILDKIYPKNKIII